MKKIWIYMSLDGDMYFSKPRKLYDYAIKFEHGKPLSYNTFLKRLRSNDRHDVIFNNGSDARIDYLR